VAGGSGPCNITIDLTLAEGSMGQKEFAAHATLRVRRVVLGSVPNTGASAGRKAPDRIGESRGIPKRTARLARTFRRSAKEFARA